MVTYIFVLAAAIAVFGITTVFRVNINKIKENPELLQKAQTNLFIGAALSESIPILLIVYGFIKMEQVSSIEELFIPAIIILFLMAYAVITVLLQSKIDVDEDKKGLIRSFSFIGIALINAIPIISLVALFMMAP
ncbi:hypothetical protein [Oceanobacillus bengalensis]|uniref:F0F1 ATP synthase subunit C n=1 Tax=Oceanobacillus bengalensis TaxID=1435466 RepID=A0A494YRH6_9BACI|nr:hypothetical protein [Oceanobacillus bengalensis]RKQ11954.1 hypothetical protein D8M05_19145 [Oceanobacillus bengalensis]